MSIKFHIKKLSTDPKRPACLIIQQNGSAPVYLYVCYFPLTHQFYYSQQESEAVKSLNWITNPEDIIDAELLEFAKTNLLQATNHAI